MISKIPKWVLLGGGVLAFNAGMINSIALLGFTHQAATHATGNFTRLAIAISQRDVQAIDEMFFILIFFFMGAVLTGVILKDGHLKLRKEYGWVLVIESGLLFAASYWFHQGSVLGEYFASMAAGMQNAMASTYSGAIIRTTHLTGVLTDLGVLIGHILHRIPVDSRRLKLFLTLISAFVIGGIGGAYLYSHFSALAMLLPACLIGLSAAIYFVVLNTKKHLYLT